MANEYRITQVAVEALHGGAPSARVTQSAVEVMHTGAPVIRMTQVAIEVLRSVDVSVTTRRRQIIN